MSGHQPAQAAAEQATEPAAPPVEWRLSCAAAAHSDLGEARDVASPLERAYSGPRLARGLAGRLAAKQATATVLGLDPRDPGLLRQILVLPGRRLACHDPALCERGHPPAVQFEPGCTVADDSALIWIDVSVSHDRDRSFAAALGVLLRHRPSELVR